VMPDIEDVILWIVMVPVVGLLGLTIW